MTEQETMIHKSDFQYSVSPGEVSAAVPRSLPKYEPPRVRVIGEEDVLSAFQVVLSAGSATWWIA
jgi:hypothetical protein